MAKEEATETTEVVTETTEEQKAEETKTEETILEEAKPVMVNPDGTFAENWIDMLPEEMRADALGLKAYGDVPNLVKATINARKLVGKNKVALPDEKSTPEQVDAFYEQLGMPKTADDYKFDVPEDLKDIFTDERMKSARDRARKIHVTQDQFAAYMEGEVESVLKLLEAQEAEDAKVKQDAEDALRREFGGAYEQRVHVANRIVAEAFPKEEQRMDFLQDYGNDPKFIRFASIIGARLTESKAIVAELTQETPKEVHRQIRELQNTPGYLAPYRDKDTGKVVQMPDDERRDINERIRELYKQLEPKPKQGLG